MLLRGCASLRSRAVDITALSRVCSESALLSGREGVMASCPHAAKEQSRKSTVMIWGNRRLRTEFTFYAQVLLIQESFNGAFWRLLERFVLYFDISHFAIGRDEVI